MYLNLWIVVQSSLLLLVGGDDCSNDYICFHDIYNTDTPAYIRDAQVPLVCLTNPDNYAIATCPRDAVLIVQSALSSAGLGAFAVRRIAEGSYFGPYLGLKSNRMLDGGRYAWVLRTKSHDLMYYIDGFYPHNSNWMRYVNCANTDTQQNLIAVQYDGDIFYQAIRDIDVGEELLVYYGDGYAKHLNINTTQLFEYIHRISKRREKSDDEQSDQDIDNLIIDDEVDGEENKH